MSVLDPDTGTLSSKPEAILPSDNNLAPTSNGQINETSTEDVSSDKMLMQRSEEKASSKKRKSSKSKTGAEKKVKSASHREDGSAISVGA